MSQLSLISSSQAEAHASPSPSETATNARRSRRRRERGQSLVEFALVAPIFFLLIFAIVDFGLGLRAWITVTQSAREAVRFASVTCATDDADSVAVEQKAVDTSAGLLTLADVEVTNCPGGSTESVVVDVTYDYDLVTPLGGLLELVSGGSVPATITLQSSTDMRLE